ncbi:MAG TPA: type II secretion system protein GspN [Kofleriaceae bacterium]|nr:type II secretion system protein GspN [Kofleriaceae bacterium]
MAVRIPHLGPRARKIARYAGFALVGLVTFVFAFQLTFPFARVKDKIIDVLSDKYDVTIGDVDRGILPGRMYFKAVSLRTRPTSADEIATTFYIEQLEVNLGLFALLRGTASVKIDAKIGPGHIKGTIASSNGGTQVDLVGSDLPSASLPMREVLGLPMSGKVRFAFDLDLPNDKSKAGKVGPNWPKAEGNVELACPSGCTIGDGKSKLRPKLKIRAQQAFAEGGIDFGKVNVDTLLADVQIKGGKLSITRFDVKSPDGELHVDFDMTLNQDLQSSLVTGCLRFKGSDGLLKREPKTHAAISTTGAPLGPDNLFHIKLDGPVRELRRLGMVCGAAANTSMDNPGAASNPRPNLTITPETPSAPAPNGRPMIPPPQVNPPPPPPATPPSQMISPMVQGLMDAGTTDAVQVPLPGPNGEMPVPGQPMPPGPNGSASANGAGSAMPPSEQ